MEHEEGPEDIDDYYDSGEEELDEEEEEEDDEYNSSSFPYLTRELASTLLGVREDATEEEVREAYKSLALDVIPAAKTGDPAGIARFQEISLAFTRLQQSVDSQGETVDCGQMQLFMQLFEEMGLQDPEHEHPRRDGYYCKHCRAYHAYSGSDGEEDGEYDDMSREFGSMHHDAERRVRREQARMHKEQKKKERKALQLKLEADKAAAAARRLEEEQQRNAAEQKRHREEIEAKRAREQALRSKAFSCAKSGDVETLKSVQKDWSFSDVNSLEILEATSGPSLLFIAAKSGGSNMVRHLLAANADTRHVFQGMEALHAAAAAGNAEIIKILCESKKTNVNARVVDNGSSPLHLASKLGHYDACVALLDAGAEITLKDKNGLTSLEIARASSKEKQPSREPKPLWANLIELLNDAEAKVVKKRTEKAIEIQKKEQQRLKEQQSKKQQEEEADRLFREKEARKLAEQMRRAEAEEAEIIAARSNKSASALAAATSETSRKKKKKKSKKNKNGKDDDDGHSAATTVENSTPLLATSAPYTPQNTATLRHTAIPFNPSHHAHSQFSNFVGAPPPTSNSFPLTYDPISLAHASANLGESYGPQVGAVGGIGSVSAQRQRFENQTGYGHASNLHGIWGGDGGGSAMNLNLFPLQPNPQLVSNLWGKEPKRENSHNLAQSQHNEFAMFSGGTIFGSERPTAVSSDRALDDPPRQNPNQMFSGGGTLFDQFSSSMFQISNNFDAPPPSAQSKIVGSRLIGSPSKASAFPSAAGASAYSWETNNADVPAIPSASPFGWGGIAGTSPFHGSLF